MELDRLISRDGHSLESALEVLQRRRGIASHAELLAFAGRIRARRRPRQEGEALHVLPSATSADERILERERKAKLRKATGSLARALGKLPGQDRLILRMRYQDGLTVRKIASVLEIDDRRLYRRLEQCLARLRAALEGEGVVFVLKPLASLHPRKPEFFDSESSAPLTFVLQQQASDLELESSSDDKGVQRQPGPSSRPPATPLTPRGR